MSLAANSEISNELWQSALDTLERTFSKPVFEMWIKPIRFISFHGTELHLAVHSKFAQDWVGSKLRGQMIGVLSELFGTPVELRLSVAEAGDSARGGSVFAPRPLEDFRAANLNARYTFEEFVVGTSNRFAHAAAQAVAGAPAHAYNPLFLYGGVGLGKTHLMHAIGHRVIARQPGAPTSSTSRARSSPTSSSSLCRTTARPSSATGIARWTCCSSTTSSSSPAKRRRKKSSSTRSTRCTNPDGSSSSRRTARRKRFRRSSRVCARVSSGACSPTSRRPDLETREAILRKKAASEKIPVPDEVTSFIAKVIPSNIRELEGALIRVVAYASLTKSPITIDLAADVLKSAIAQAPLRADHDRQDQRHGSRARTASRSKRWTTGGATSASRRRARSRCTSRPN